MYIIQFVFVCFRIELEFFYLNVNLEMYKNIITVRNCKEVRRNSHLKYKLFGLHRRIYLDWMICL